MPKKRPTFLYTERGVVVGNTKQSQIYDEIIVRVEDYFLRKLKSIKKETHQIDKIDRLLLHNPNTFLWIGWQTKPACVSGSFIVNLLNERG